MNRRTFGFQVAAAFAVLPRQNGKLKPYTRAEVAVKVKEIIIRQLNVDATDVIGTANLVDDLGVDSLDTVELLARLEEVFELDIPDEVCETAKTVAAVNGMVEKLLSAQGRLTAG